MMIPVTFKKKTYRIAFDHLERDYVVPKTKKATAISEKRRVTTCSIWLQPKRGDIKLVASGRAVCRPPDKFSRPEGRERALARAVVALTGPRKRLVLRGLRGKKYVIKERVVNPPEARREDIRDAKALRKAVWDAYFATVSTKHGPMSAVRVAGPAFIRLPTDAEAREGVKRLLAAAGAPATED